MKKAKPAGKGKRIVRTRKPFPIVGVGASAGGLEAVTAFLRALPPKSGIAFVLVQHLDPHHESVLHKLLALTTRMHVTQANDGDKVVPDRVYVIPPNRDMVIEGGVLRLVTRRADGGRHLPVDQFLESLARDQGGNAVGVILSGTGSDGTLGLQAIKAGGGIAIAQDPATAQSAGMPENAIEAGCVDLILSPAAIAEQLSRIARLPDSERAAALPDARDVLEHLDSYQQVLRLLEGFTGVDFNLYKPATIRRRIARRMSLHRIDTLDKYMKYLRAKPVEVRALYHDIFIHVTSFFREPDTFEALRQIVFPKLARRGRRPDDPIRVWVPGCSTGEEAYSIAIALTEFLDPKPSKIPFQLFGTDISEPAISRARSGIYSASALAAVSAQRLAKFFVKEGEDYQISKTIRDRCVFARQDLGKDPPFSNLDLISCCNVLIYMGPKLHHRILSVFHYALKPVGFLVLGKSESVTTSGDLFTQEHRKVRIYSRNPVTPTPIFDLGAKVKPTKPYEPPPLPQTEDVDVLKIVDRIVRERYAPAAFLVDADLQIVHFQGDTGRYLAPSPGAATLHLLKLVQNELALDLRTSVHKANKEGRPIRREGLRLAKDGASKEVDLEVIPIRDGQKKRPNFLMLINEVKRKETGTSPGGEEAREVARLKHELAATREHLQSVIETGEATNEELRAVHEEVLSTNEELQSTNEELETAKEELQSSNEELTTLNEELQNRNAELGQMANDLSNLLVGVNLPIVMLGGDRRIRRFTPAAQGLLNLIPGDIGRPIGNIKPNIEVDNLEALVAEVIGKGDTLERDVQDRKGHWYSLRLRPYKTAENKTDGVLMALLDIDVLKRSFDQIQQSHTEAVAERDLSSTLLDMTGALVVVRDAAGRIVGFNHAAEEISGYSFNEVKGKTLWGALTPPEERDQAKASFEASREDATKNHETTWLRKDGARRVLLCSTFARRDPAGPANHVVTTGLDITQRKLAEDALRDSEQQLRALTASLYTAQEDERKRVARDLHDDLNQRMGMLAIEVQMLERDPPATANLMRRRLRALRGNVDRLSDSLRRAAYQLHPAILEHFGLPEALETYCSDFSKLHSIRCKVTHSDVPHSIPGEVALCLYRVAQECLSNVAKHSGAAGAKLTLRGTGSGLSLSISDNGKGFDPNVTPRGLGFVGIRERARLVRGTVSISSRPGRGTDIEVQVPLVSDAQPPLPEASG